ncbi:MAG: hypothetical protein IT337_06330 [Thermomicrobiales bacterium]|nr:hypothetical protein [Thermomicrobiales bacterium]
MSTSRSGTGAHRQPAPPVWLWVGLCLVAVAWWVAWFGPPPIHFYTFFPLWLGYILTVDGLVHVRAGASLLTRSPARWALLFAFSIPLWWLFEWANQFLGNWRYVMPYRYAPLTYFLLSSLAFSTVMPAIFETATLLRTFAPFRAARRWLRIAPGRGGLIAISLLGAAVFAASLLWPSLFFPLVWVGGFLLLDPINRLMGSKSIAADVARGQWGAVLLLWAAGLVCGFFWEMWNVFSMPKWVYEIPFAADPKLFEMPVLGYGGYLPFALEVYAVYNLLHGLLFRRADTFLPFGSTGRPESPS